MGISLVKVSEILKIPIEQLEKKSLISFVLDQIRQAEWDISDIKGRYGVLSRKELEEKIKSKEIYSHPAWEDLIYWENLEDYIQRLKEVEEELRVA